jgi:uncharacterized coiled-coil protein SlyX
MANEESERLGILESRYAFLEKHVAAQDRAMLEMAARLDLLEARQKQLRERVERGTDGGTIPDERPPHY